MSTPRPTGPSSSSAPAPARSPRRWSTHGVDPARLVLVEFNPVFCRLLRSRFPAATVVQGDAYGCRHLLGALMREPAAAIVSGLPLITKPLRTRLRLISEAFGLLTPNAPFIQFTYAVVSPIPKTLPGVQARRVRAHLAEPAAGPGLGLSQGLTPLVRRLVAFSTEDRCPLFRKMRR